MDSVPDPFKARESFLLNPGRQDVVTSITVFVVQKEGGCHRKSVKVEL